jgi:hypothetical protein
MSEDKRYQLETLADMQRRAHNESLGKGISPKPRLMELLASNLQFKEYDHSALEDNWFRSGPRPDLDCPSLKGRPTWAKTRRI